MLLTRESDDGVDGPRLGKGSKGYISPGVEPPTLRLTRVLLDIVDGGGASEEGCEAGLGEVRAGDPGMGELGMG